jgi:hypothetical protein
VPFQRFFGRHRDKLLLTLTHLLWDCSTPCAYHMCRDPLHRLLACSEEGQDELEPVAQVKMELIAEKVLQSKDFEQE